MFEFSDLVILFSAGLAVVAVFDMLRRLAGVSLSMLDNFIVRLALVAALPFALGLAIEHAARATIAKDASGALWQPAALRQLALDRLAEPLTAAAVKKDLLSDSDPPQSPVSVGKSGFSGLARIDGNTLVGVKDKKNRAVSALGSPDSHASELVFLITEKGPIAQPLRKRDGTSAFDATELPSDLESVCVLPGSIQNEEGLLATVLAAESSYFDDPKDEPDRGPLFGRLFRLELKSGFAYVTGIARLAKDKYQGAGNDDQPQYEGMICGPGQKPGSVQFILASRETMSLVAFNEVEFDEGKVVDVNERRRAYLKNGSPEPSCTTATGNWRDFGELHFDRNTGQLWATSTFELEEDDTTVQVCSTIYRITSPDCGDDPFKLLKQGCRILSDKKPAWTHSKIRIEGLTEGPMPGTLSVSTEQDQEDAGEFIGVVTLADAER